MVLRSIWRVPAAAGIAIIGAFLLLSGGSLLDSANDALFRSSEQPASSSGQQPNTGFQTTESIDVQSVDRVIRASSDVEAVVDDTQYTVEGHRLVYVENELWGVSAILRLDEATRLDGPWITVDTGALMESATQDLDIEQFSDLGVGNINELSHEELDDVLSGHKFTSEDYSVNTDTYEVDTEFIYVTIQPESGSMLALVPFEAPPNLWGGPVPKNSSGQGSIGSTY